MRSLKLAAVLCVLALFIAGSAFAQQMPNPYGPPEIKWGSELLRNPIPFLTEQTL